MRELPPPDRDRFLHLRLGAHAPGRATTIALVLVAVALGGALLAVGFLLLLALAAAGVAFGAGWLLVQRLRRVFGRARPRERDATSEPRLNQLLQMNRTRNSGLDSWLTTDAPREPELDPSLEIAVIEPDESLRSRPDSDPRPSRDTTPHRRP